MFLIQQTLASDALAADEGSYLPDFTAYISTETVRCIQISRPAYALAFFPAGAAGGGDSAARRSKTQRLAGIGAATVAKSVELAPMGGSGGGSGGGGGSVFPRDQRSNSGSQERKVSFAFPSAEVAGSGGGAVGTSAPPNQGSLARIRSQSDTGVSSSGRARSHSDTGVPPSASTMSAPPSRTRNSGVEESKGPHVAIEVSLAAEAEADFFGVFGDTPSSSAADKDPRRPEAPPTCTRPAAANLTSE